MTKLKSFLFPLVKPFLPILYYPRYKKLRKQIISCFEEEADVFCFLPAYHIGGAEKVHLQILSALQGYKITTIINYKSKSNTYKNEFKQRSTQFIDLHAVGNHYFFQKKIATLLAIHFNKIDYPFTVFGCNSILFYLILPELNNTKAKKVDLLHAFSPYDKNPIEKSSIKYVELIDKRIVINQKTKDDYKRQYEFFFKDISLLNRVEIVTNALDQSCDEVQKLFTLPLKCLFVGRGSPEKRVHLFEKLATECLQQNLPLSFTAVGNLQNYLSPAHSKVLTALGEISNASDIQNIYKEHQVLITTSSYEGFPLTIMESMCNGLINVSTAVGGIPEHIIDHQNGILIGALNEKEIKNQLMESLKELLNDMDLCYSISGNSVKYARDNFSFEVFKQKYVQSIINKV